MWVIVLKSLLVLVNLVFVLFIVYLFSEIRRDIRNIVEKKKEANTIETSKYFFPTVKEFTWEKAKEICSDNGGRLPTIDELKKVLTDCEGGCTSLANSIGQYCYQKKGFASYSCWSSTTYENHTNLAWYVSFRHSNTDYNFKSYINGVCCLRSGQ